jgi:hypothetical protein
MHSATLVQHWCNTGAAISEYQPAALLNRFVAKACADGIRAVVVTRWRSPLFTGPSSPMPPSSTTRMVTCGFDASGQLSHHEGRFRGRDPRGPPPPLRLRGPCPQRTALTRIRRFHKQPSSSASSYISERGPRAQSSGPTSLGRNSLRGPPGVDRAPLGPTSQDEG